MLANLTLADAQLQIGATIVLLLMAYGLGWLSARAKDWLQRELLEAGMDLPPAQMTPFRGPLGPAIVDERLARDGNLVFLKFYPSRAERGVAAAKFLWGDEYYWMSSKDIDDNRKEFGESPELEKARAAYNDWVNNSATMEQMALPIYEVRAPTPSAIDDQPSTIDDLYTEHSPQIPELRKPSGVFEDDWRGGEYGGSNSMLMRNVKEIED